LVTTEFNADHVNYQTSCTCTRVLFKYLYLQLKYLYFNLSYYSIIIIIIHAFITHAHSVVVLNQRCSLGGQHGKGVDGLFEKVSFQTAFEGVESG